MSVSASATTIPAGAAPADGDAVIASGRRAAIIIGTGMAAVVIMVAHRRIRIALHQRDGRCRRFRRMDTVAEAGTEDSNTDVRL